jgi:hypothetical protein
MLVAGKYSNSTQHNLPMMDFVDLLLGRFQARLNWHPTQSESKA